MDSRDATLSLYLVFCCVSAALPSLNYGYNTGVTNIPEDVVKDCLQANPHTLPFPECLPMSDWIWGLANGCWALGGLVGSLAASSLSSRFGRRPCLMYNNILFIIGALLLGLSVRPEMFLVGRAIAGIGSGIATVIQPVYIGEIASQRYRGALGSLSELGIVLGIVVAQAITLFLTEPPKWRIAFSLTGVSGLVGLCAMYFSVESPQYLIMKGREAEARVSMQRLRKGCDITREFEQAVREQTGEVEPDRIIINGLEAPSESVTADSGSLLASSHGKKSLSIPQLLMNKELRGVTSICAFIFTAQMLCGINAIVFYSTSIFQAKFEKRKSEYMTVGLNGGALLVAILITPVIDKLSRKKMLIFSQTGIMLSCVAIVLSAHYHVTWLSILALGTFVFCFTVGLGPVPWIIIAEVFPTFALDSATAIALSLNWIFNFAVDFAFPTIQNNLGDYAFAVFAVIGLVQLIIITIFAPDTQHQQDINPPL